MKLKLLLYTVSVSIVLCAYAQQPKGNNFELANKSDQPIYFSLSDPAKVFKIVPQTDTQTISRFITTTPTSYELAPEGPFIEPDDFNRYKGKLITLAPGEALAAFVDTAKQVYLLIARGKSSIELDELRLYRFARDKTLYLKINEHYALVPQEGTLKPLKSFKRFSRSGYPLEQNITPEGIKLVKTVIK
jgi:hypothetical protein